MHKRGFTLIELMVVMSIMAMLSSVIISSVQSARDKGRVAAGLTFQKHTESAYGDKILAKYDFNNSTCSGTLLSIVDIGPNMLNLIPPGGSESDCEVLSSDTPTKAGRSYNLALGSVQYSFLSVDNGGLHPIDKPFSKISIGFWAKSSGLPTSLFEIFGDGSGFTVTSDSISNSFYLDISQTSPTNASLAGLLLNDDKWHYNLITLGGTKLNYYRDGKFVATKNVPAFSNSNNTAIDTVAILGENNTEGKTLLIDDLVFIGDAF